MCQSEGLLLLPLVALALWIKPLRMKIDSDDMITQAEAARIRGVSEEAIRYLVKRERFKIFKIGGKIFLSKREVEHFKPSVGGRPPKKPARRTRNKQ